MYAIGGSPIVGQWHQCPMKKNDSPVDANANGYATQRQNKIGLNPRIASLLVVPLCNAAFDLVCATICTRPTVFGRRLKHNQSMRCPLKA